MFFLVLEFEVLDDLRSQKETHLEHFQPIKQNEEITILYRTNPYLKDFHVKTPRTITFFSRCYSQQQKPESETLILAQSFEIRDRQTEATTT